MSNDYQEEQYSYFRAEYAESQTDTEICQCKDNIKVELREPTDNNQFETRRDEVFDLFATFDK